MSSWKLICQAWHESKAGTPPDKLRSPGSRMASHQDRSLGRSTNVNVEGIVSIDALISQFRECMSELLDERMAAIIVEVEMVKQACSDLDRRVEALEKETVNSKVRWTSPPSRIRYGHC